MLCCLLSTMMTGNLAVAGRIGVSLMKRSDPLALIALLIVGAAGIAAGAALSDHGAHYAARAEANQRSVFAEILAAPFCSGEAQS